MGINLKKPITLKYKFVAILFINLAFSLNALAVRFYSINSLYGISMREANSVCKDSNGFIWVSSKTGILRLTDDDYRIYQIPYESANIITVKLVYSNSVLLAYTNSNQIFKYNEISDRFELLINLKNAFQANIWGVNSVLIEDSNTYWIGSTDGLYLLKDAKLTLMGKDRSIFHRMTWYNDHQIVIARGNEISTFDTKTLKFSSIYKNVAIPAFEVSSLFVDKSNDQLWVGTLSSGLFYYGFKSHQFSDLKIQSFPKQPILAIESNSDESLLIGIDGQGVWEINKNGTSILNIFKENVDNPFSLRGNGVYDIFCEQDKRVWICTYTGGVSYFEKTKTLIDQLTHQVNNQNSLVNNDVNNIIEDSRGNIWFATNNGISCWTPLTNEWKSFYVNEKEQAQVFLTLCEDNKGRIWAGTYSSGVYILDERTGKELAHYSKEVEGSPFANEYVFDIYKDSFGNIWIGGINSEVICYNEKDDKFQKYSKNPLYSFAELSSDKMLLGCTSGLSLLDKKTGETKIIKGDFLVLDIIVLDGIAWLATSGDGLVRFDPQSGKVERFTTQIGLPSNFISSIACVDGFLWLGTENGLCRFNPKDKSVVVYSSIEPLAHVSFNRNAQVELRNGQLAWGTNSGAIIFNPKTIQQFQSKGKIFFQDLSISGRSIREHSAFRLNTPLDNLKEIKLKYNQNTLNLELLPIGVAVGSKFSWKMEGLDNSWSQPTNHAILTYNNMPSNHFTLKIRLYDNSLSRIIAKRTLAIEITPPFWDTWWFIVITFLIVSTIIYIALSYYVNKIKQHHTEEKVRFFTNTAHDIRTSLTLIKAPVEELSKEKNLTESGKYYLNLAIEQARQLSSVVTQLMDFQKVDIGREHLLLSMTDIVKLVSTRNVMLASYSQSKNIELEFISDCESYMTAVDEPKMEKIIDNLITNAIKYSPNNSQVHIDLKCDDKKWVLQVKDYGIGISRKAQRQLFKEFYRGDNAINSKVVGSGIGLLLVKNYVAMHGGNISYNSQENVGSTFQVVIPFKSIFGELVAANALSDIQIDSSDIKEVSLPTESANEISASKEMKVLIVEDNDDLLNFMKHALGDDFKVFTAVDGEIAWEFVSKHIPDLVVSDIMMPNMDGFELCEIMKSTYETSHIPIVLLTALSEKTDQLHGLGLGADDYLTKPFDLNLLIQRIKSIILNREIVREKALKLIKGDSTEHILANDLNDKFVKKMLEVVRTNISNTKFDKDEFASAMNVSSSLLYKKIKSLTDQSPTDFIKTVRLNHAVELLQSRNYSVTEVSELCGFASLTYFGIIFKKHFGKSPSEIIE